MHWHDGFDAHAVVQHLLDRRSIEIERSQIDIGKDWTRSDAHDSAGGSEETEGRGNHFVPSSDSGSGQREEQCIGTRVAPDAGGRAQELRSGFFELRNGFAEDEMLRVADLLNGPKDFCANGRVLAGKIQERNSFPGFYDDLDCVRFHREGILALEKFI